MEAPQLQIQEFLKDRQRYCLIDVRSEGEFKRGHIAGAINIPVLTNEERVLVGTLYKQQGTQSAVLKGFELAGPRFSQMMKQSLKLAAGRPVMVYCWRGGMRSSIFSWLLQMAGMQVFRIKGGYKRYRNLTYETVRKPFPCMVLAGRTGTGKTEILSQMAASGFQVVDLEQLAGHKGSVFGGIGMPEQPSHEGFENQLAEQLWQLDTSKPIWLENESQMIGMVALPNELKAMMNEAPVLEIQLDSDWRQKRIANEYGNLPAEDLLAATRKLEKRLGNLRMRQAIAAIEAGETNTWVTLLMQYYDKGYDFALEKLPSQTRQILNVTGMPVETVMETIRQIEKELTRK